MKPQGWIWASGFALILLLGVLLAQTEGQYLQFILSLNEIQIQVLWDKTAVEPQRTLLTFNIVFDNTSQVPMWVEAINTQMYIAGEYAGAYSIPEGSYEIPPQSKQGVALQVDLWTDRSLLLEQAEHQGGELRLEGRARVRIGIGTALKSFYPVAASFALGTDHAHSH